MPRCPTRNTTGGWASSSCPFRDNFKSTRALAPKVIEQPPVWSDFSFVAASGYRERVMNALSRKPKFPKEGGRETRTRITHVSRALREMGGRGLVNCLNPEAKARGRIYGVTEAGASLLAYFDRSNRRFVPVSARGTPYVGFVPKIRGSSVLRILAALRDSKGKEALDGAIRSWTIDPREITEDSWISVDACAELLELVEARFGDGSYSFIRAVFATTAPSFPTIRGELFFFSSRRRHTRFDCDWSSDVCSSDLMPPESSFGYAASKPSRPTRLMARATASRCAPRCTPRASRPIATFCATVSQGSKANDWNTIAAAPSTPSSGWPRYSTVPSAGWASPANRRSSVLLPHPEGPTSATTSCSRTVRATSRSASRICPLGRRKRCVTCCASRSTASVVMFPPRSASEPTP